MFSPSLTSVCSNAAPHRRQRLPSATVNAAARALSTAWGRACRRSTIGGPSQPLNGCDTCASVFHVGDPLFTGSEDAAPVKASFQEHWQCTATPALPPLRSPIRP